MGDGKCVYAIDMKEVTDALACRVSEGCFKKGRSGE